MSSWAEPENVWSRRKKDRQVLFVVRYRDQPDAYVRIPPALASFGSFALSNEGSLERQARGEIPPGDIVGVVRAR